MLHPSSSFIPCQKPLYINDFQKHAKTTGRTKQGRKPSSARPRGFKGEHMALYPRLTRTAIRITIEALEEKMATLNEEGKEVAADTIRELRYQMESANADNRRRAEQKRGKKQHD